MTLARTKRRWLVSWPGADKLLSLRRELRLTQQQVADAIGVSNPTIAEWESGKKIPSAHNQRRIMEWSGGLISLTEWDSLAERERAPIVPVKLPARYKSRAVKVG